MLPSLAFFIATQDQFAMDIKKTLSTINSSAEDIIIDMIQTCADLIERDNDLVPQTKHIYLRVYIL